MLVFVILNLGKVFCVGYNYEIYCQEIGCVVMEYLFIFVCFVDLLGVYNQLIVMLKVLIDFDYEGELVVIIGKGGCYISEEDVMLYVVGYVCFNDVFVCDW